MPANTRRVYEMNLALAPRIEGGRCCSHPILLDYAGKEDVLPPGVNVVNRGEQHEIALHFVVLEMLEDERCCTEAKLGVALSLPYGGEAEVLEEVFRAREVGA
jgi:hypothetical protein